MVLGLGTDMIEIARIEHSLTRYGDAFMHRIYTNAEIAYCQQKKKNSAESFAARGLNEPASARGGGAARLRNPLPSRSIARRLIESV